MSPDMEKIVPKKKRTFLGFNHENVRVSSSSWKSAICIPFILKLFLKHFAVRSIAGPQKFPHFFNFVVFWEAFSRKQQNNFR
jgi:hypothetical protein